MADQQASKSYLQWQMTGPFGDGLITLRAVSGSDEYFIHCNGKWATVRTTINGIFIERKMGFYKAMIHCALAEKSK